MTDVVRAGKAALVALAGLGVLVWVLAIGAYEHSITVVTHGRPDLAVFAFAYEVFDHVVRPWGLVYPATLVRWLGWVPAAATVVLWWRVLVARPDRVTLAWVSAAVSLQLLSVLVSYLTVGRMVAYPLWLAAAAVLVVAVRRLVRVTPWRGAA